MLFPVLPEKIPMHINVKGEIDGWGNKYQALALPIITIVLGFLTPKLYKIKNSNYNPKPANIISFGCVCLFNILNYVFLYAAFYPTKYDFNNIVSTSLCIFFIVIGNFFPKLKQNSFVGIRLPWTINNEAVWYKTHRLGGAVWVIGGIIMFPLSLFSSSRHSSMVLAIGLIIMTIIPSIYSYVIYKRINA
jgi:uncharacterized membrane protein